MHPFGRPERSLKVLNSGMQSSSNKGKNTDAAQSADSGPNIAMLELQPQLGTVLRVLTSFSAHCHCQEISSTEWHRHMNERRFQRSTPPVLSQPPTLPPPPHRLLRFPLNISFLHRAMDPPKIPLKIKRHLQWKHRHMKHPSSLALIKTAAKTAAAGGSLTLLGHTDSLPAPAGGLCVLPRTRTPQS